MENSDDSGLEQEDNEKGAFYNHLEEPSTTAMGIDIDIGTQAWLFHCSWQRFVLDCYKGEIFLDPAICIYMMP